MISDRKAPAASQYEVLLESAREIEAEIIAEIEKADRFKVEQQTRLECIRRDINRYEEMVR